MLVFRLYDQKRQKPGVLLLGFPQNLTHCLAHSSHSSIYWTNECLGGLQFPSSQCFWKERRDDFLWQWATRLFCGTCSNVRFCFFHFLQMRFLPWELQCPSLNTNLVMEWENVTPGSCISRIMKKQREPVLRWATLPSRGAAVLTMLVHSQWTEGLSESHRQPQPFPAIRIRQTHP